MRFILCYFKTSFLQEFSCDDRCNVTLSGSLSSLDFLFVKESDFGSYTCTTSNDLGSLDVTLQLLPPGPSDPPQECHLTDVTDSSAAFKCVSGFNGGKWIGAPKQWSVLLLH